MPRRNLPLVLLPVLGALAVGTLLVLGRDEVRSRAAARSEPAEGVRSRRARPRPPVVLVPVGMRPGAPDPRPVARVEDLLGEMVDSRLAPEARLDRMRRVLEVLDGRAAPAVRTLLLEMLATVEPRFRRQVADVIGSLRGDVDAAQALVRMLDAGADGTTREAILTALGRMEVREATPRLMALLGEDFPDEPLLIRTIGRLATTADLEQLLARLDRPLRADSRTEIEQVLRGRDLPHAVLDRMAAALDDAKLKERRSLLRILSGSSDPAHIEAMRGLLGRRMDEESRGLVIRALGEHGDPESAQTLLRLVEGGRAEDRRRAAAAILAIREPDTVALLAEDWHRLGGDGRAAVMGAVARLPAPTPLMLEVARKDGIDDRDPRVRAAAARALGKRGRDDAVDLLAGLVERSTQAAETSAALGALRVIGTRKAALAGLRLLDAVPDAAGRDRWRRQFDSLLDAAS